VQRAGHVQVLIDGARELLECFRPETGVSQLLRWCFSIAREIR
jgi:hypothetical protein